MKLEIFECIFKITWFNNINNKSEDIHICFKAISIFYFQTEPNLNFSLQGDVLPEKNIRFLLKFYWSNKQHLDRVNIWSDKQNFTALFWQQFSLERWVYSLHLQKHLSSWDFLLLEFPKTKNQRKLHHNFHQNHIQKNIEKYRRRYLCKNGGKANQIEETKRTEEPWLMASSFQY